MIPAPHLTSPRCAWASAPGRIGLGARRFARARRLRRGWPLFAGVRRLLLRRPPPGEPRGAGAAAIHVGVRLAWSPSWTVAGGQRGPAPVARRVETAAVRAPVLRRCAAAGAVAALAPRGGARSLHRGTLAALERGAPVLRLVRAAVQRGEREPVPVHGAAEAQELALPRRARRDGPEPGGPPAPSARRSLRVEDRELAAGRRKVVVAEPARRAQAVAAAAPAAAPRPGRAAAGAAAQAARSAIDVEALTADVVRRIDRRVNAWRERTGRL